MWKSFPPAIHEVYPKAKIRYDYFHIFSKLVNKHLDDAMKNYSRASSIYRESSSLLKEYGAIEEFS